MDLHQYSGEERERMRQEKEKRRREAEERSTEALRCVTCHLSQTSVQLLPKLACWHCVMARATGKAMQVG